jgi:glycosyltransferase involved in cell wall biosynthesis
VSGATWLDVVLPCLDESAALPWVLANLPAGARAIVVDNGSTDGSAALARRAGAVVVHAPQRGYGAACHAGLLAARADVVAFCDCDATIDPRAAEQLAAHLGRADLVVARRRPASSAAWPVATRLANRELARRVRRRTGLDIRDVGPLRVARREQLLGLDVRDRRSGYPVETLVRAADRGWQVIQVDVEYRERLGHSKVSGTWRGSWHAVRDMSRALTA